MRDLFSLKGKRAFVTGAASGIGAEIAKIFSQAGAEVHLADRDFAGVESLAKELSTNDGKAVAHTLDVSREEECVEVAKCIISKYGKVDIVVNNAGIGCVGNILQTSGHDMDRLYAVNVRGVFNVTKAFLPTMIEAGEGIVINLASIGGIVGIKDRFAYCASKFAVVGITKAMALDHAAQGIRVNCICPGRVETPFVKARIAEYPDPEAAYREMSSTQLNGRMVRPDEVAAAALYLASDASKMVIGTPFLIDGGWSAGK